MRSLRGQTVIGLFLTADDCYVALILTVVVTMVNVFGYYGCKAAITTMGLTITTVI